MSKLQPTQNLFDKIKNLVQEARAQVTRTINKTMVVTYYEIGRYIVEDEQAGAERAAYAEMTLQNLSEQLNNEFGRGFSLRNLRSMRNFYLAYSIRQTPSAEFDFTLSWSHYVFLISIDNEAERKFYEIEATKNQWSLRELKRQFNSALYERLALSTDKDGIKTLSEKGQIIEKPEQMIKDPYILEFLDLPTQTQYSESDIEQALIDKLQAFLLELGKGFTFVARQSRITFAEKHFYIDLVFYNRILQCFVLIDLKIGELTHQALGQMQMYVNYFDREKRLEHENKTIGIVICRQKEDAIVEYTLPENTQIFASQYQTVLPDKAALQAQVRAILERENKEED